MMKTTTRVLSFLMIFLLGWVARATDIGFIEKFALAKDRKEALKLLKQIIDDEEKLLEKTREERKRDLIRKLNGPASQGDSKPEKKPSTEKKP